MNKKKKRMKTHKLILFQKFYLLEENMTNELVWFQIPSWILYFTLLIFEPVLVGPKFKSNSRHMYDLLKLILYVLKILFKYERRLICWQEDSSIESNRLHKEKILYFRLLLFLFERLIYTSLIDIECDLIFIWKSLEIILRKYIPYNIIIKRALLT